MRAGIDDGLVGAGEDAFHGFQIHALAGDVGRLLVLVVDLQEARGLALGVGDGLLAIGLGVLDDLGRPAAGFRHHFVGVSLRFVLRPFEVGACRLHVEERIDDLGRRIDLLQLDVLDQNAGAVGIERLLHQLLHRFSTASGPPVSSGWTFERPITSRMELSATAFTVPSGFWTLKR